jgi:hypothetical protein
MSPLCVCVCVLQLMEHFVLGLHRSILEEELADGTETMAVGAIFRKGYQWCVPCLALSS